MTSKTDPPALRAVLIGTATHTDPARSGLDSIPQVANNLVDLARELTAPRGIFPPGAVETVQDPANPQVVFDAIRRQPLTGTLLCYFAGHGLRADRRLCLALPGSMDRHGEQRGTSLTAEALLEQLVNPPNRRVVLILDCCYARLVFDEPLAADVHLLAAVGRAVKAWSKGPRNTLFTGALLELLRRGAPSGTRKLDLETLYRQLVTTFRDEDRTRIPHQRSVDGSGCFPIAPNRAFEAAMTPEGFASRTAFADKVGRSGDPQYAARLFADVVADARRSGRIKPGDVFRSRMLTASWNGQAGDVQGAVFLLEALLADDSVGAAEDDVALATKSLDYWCSIAANSPG